MLVEPAFFTFVRGDARHQVLHHMVQGKKYRSGVPPTKLRQDLSLLESERRQFDEKYVQ